MKWAAVAMLTALYTLNALDRYVIAVVLEPIRHEFRLTDTQLGAIGGLAHSIAYTACVLPVGWLLDRTNRVKLLSSMLALWSAITAMGALTTGFWSLFTMRMGVGAAESAGSSGTQSLLANLFPVKGRASAMGVVFSGTAIGTGLVFAVGGPVAAHWGWRAVFLLAGIPGILLAALMWFYMPEPGRAADGGAKSQAAVPMRRVLWLFATTRPLLLSGLGSAIAGMTVVSVWVWITPLLIRQHGFTLAQAGLMVGFAAGVLKFASGFLSGFVGDWIAKGRISRLWIVPSTALFLSVPIALALALVTSKVLAVLLVMCLSLSLGTHYAAPRTILMTVASDNIRGSVASIEQLLVGVIVGALGPFITGAISDHLGGKDSVGLALAATVSFNLIAAWCFWQGMRGLDGATEKVGAEPAPAAA
jgi:predicted MFS family arabinose efflux permease